MNNKIPQKSDLEHTLKKNDQLMICSRCNGTGTDPRYIKLNNKLYDIQKAWGREDRITIFVNCRKCDGYGYIDWVDNAVGSKNKNDREPDLTSVRNAAKAFLCSALYGANSDFDVTDFYDGYMNDFFLSEDLVDLDKGIKNFESHKDLVMQHLTLEDRMFYYSSIRGTYIYRGKTCTNCFELVLDKDPLEKTNKRDKLNPHIPGEEINYCNKIIKDKNYPLFRLCDDCRKNLSDKDIIHIKREAFDPYDTSSFSHKYHSKIEDRINSL